MAFSPANSQKLFLFVVLLKGLYIKTIKFFKSR